MISTPGYPSDDPEQLKQMLREAFELLGPQQEIDQARQSQIIDLKEQIKLLRDRLFGRKPEQSLDPVTPQLMLYLFENALGRHGVDIPRQPLAHRVIQCCERFQPLLNLMSSVIHCNETRAQVLKEPDRDPTSLSWMWGRASGLPNRKALLFGYVTRRAGKVPLRLLDGYHGYPMTDDAAYNVVTAQPRVERLPCMAHARRKFIEAQKYSPRARRIEQISSACSNAPAMNSVSSVARKGACQC